MFVDLDPEDVYNQEDLAILVSLEEAGLENLDFDTVPNAQKAYFADEA